MKKLEENKTNVCESCGNNFDCGAARNSCWCMKFNLTDEARDEIKAKFNDCLCDDCLEKYVTN